MSEGNLKGITSAEREQLKAEKLEVELDLEYAKKKLILELARNGVAMSMDEIDQTLLQHSLIKHEDAKDPERANQLFATLPHESRSMIKLPAYAPAWSRYEELQKVIARLDGRE